jgi:hypothetical protein
MQCSECGKMVRGRASPTGKCKECRAKKEMPMPAGGKKK